jgi:arylsulfatase
MPNVLWICSDSQRWDTLGCAGNPFVRTPNLDRLASQGVRFTQAISQSPVCTPSRGSFLTGRMPSAIRLSRNGQVCPEDLPLVTQSFAAAGFVNGLVGKLHLNHCDRRLACGPEWWKVDSGWWETPTESRIDDGYHEFHWSHSPNLKHRTNAYARWAVARGAVGPEAKHREDSKYVQDGLPGHLSQSTWCADTACGFIEAQAGGVRPWLLSVNLFAPHYPFNPPPEILAPYLERLDDLPLPIWLEGEESGHLPQQRALATEIDARKDGHGYPCTRMTPRDHRMVKAAYYAAIEHLDATVGRMLATLDTSGQADNTIVLFHSDHGEMLGDHGFYTKHTSLLYDGAVRVPLIARYPGYWQAGAVDDGLVELTDLAPTLATACKIPVTPGTHGRDLGPRLRGDHGAASTIRSDALTESYGSLSRGHHTLRLTTRDHTLVLDVDDQAGQLFVNAETPSQSCNHWDDVALAGIRSRLMLQITSRLTHATDHGLEQPGVF